MKTNLLLAAFLLFSFGIVSAQSTADVSGIGIQGIARDANNSARKNQAVSLELSFYYINDLNQEIEIIKITKTVETDAFGVFSTVAETNLNNNPAFANTETYLRISDDTTIITDEKLKSVAYSYSAANGVPTGSIMPFMGTVVPNGWVLCDGRSLSSIPGSSFLQTLLGSSTVPDLGGMFLRGTGSNNLTNKNTTLGERQDDTYVSHNHTLGTAGGTNSTGNHDHSVKGINYNDNDRLTADYNRLVSYQPFNNGDNATATAGGIDTSVGNSNGVKFKEFVVTNAEIMANTGAHTHSLTGRTNTSGDTDETRPTSYGVNYIIKL